MSLILEALKRSEAERRLGESPDLLAPPPEFVGVAPARTLPKGLIAIVLAVLALGSVAAWWWFAIRTPATSTPAVVASPTVESPAPSPPQRMAAAPAVADSPALLGVPVQSVPPATPAPAPAPPPAAQQAPAAPHDPTSPLLPPDTVVGRSPVPVEPQAPPMSAPPTSAATAPAPTNVDPNTGLAAAQPPTPVPTTPPAQPAPTPTPDTVVADAPADTAAPPPPDAVVESPPTDLPDLSALPLAVRQALPPLVLNMHLYRATPAERVVILDGKRLHEGDTAGDLEVAEIRSDGVVLVARGQRFLLSRLPR